MNEKTAIFAGGCFWCMEPPFAKLDGIIKTEPGYTGGHTENPAYEQVCRGGTGHFEAVRVTYDADAVTYDQLLDVFWRQIDPADAGGQFADRGDSYKTAVFYADEAQRIAAEDSRLRMQRLLGTAIHTKILPAAVFYPAEGYHCEYYNKNPEHYNRYKRGSGREEHIQSVWGDEALRQRLSPLQYNVTRRGATEPPFRNEYWDNHEAGLYVDVITGEPLFSSLDKFDSGCGWPSFTRPLDAPRVTEKRDLSHGMVRTEVRTKVSDAHLGHVFDDGPNGMPRYCINSAALRFVPLDRLVEEGYGSYKKLFEKK